MILRCTIALVLTLAPTIAQESTPSPEPAPTATPAPPDLRGVVMEPGFWQKTVTDLTPVLAQLKFAWISTNHDGARSVSPNLSLGGESIDEAVFRFTEEKPTSATLLFYSRGLSKELNERLFEERVSKVQTTLTNILGVVPTKKARDVGSVVRADGVEWETSENRLVLEWSTSKDPFRAEFLRLTVTPKTSRQRAIGETTVANANRAAVKKFVGQDHVVRAAGDVKIVDVPMVDQGERGYCVVASAERLMRYYGATVDQTELAQIANSDADKGTSTQAMAESLKKLTGRLGVKLRPLYDWDVADFLKIIDDYNRIAKKEKAQEIRLSGNIIDVQEILRKMDPAIYKAVRLKKAADETKFQRDIARNIDEGIPLLWSVNIGMVPEGNVKQYSGGHMRLIIGYNTAKNEVIYSDSWGPGHEEKRMPLEDAWIITSGLSSLQPIGS